MNAYTITEIAHQKRIRISPTPLPAMTRMIVSYDEATRVLRLRTYYTQLPFAHGLMRGDVVRIGDTESQKLYVPQGDVWELRDAPSCRLRHLWGRCGVVAEYYHADDKMFPIPNREQVEVCVVVNPSRLLSEHVGSVVSVHAELQPFNVCFGLPGSVPSRLLGFANGATQWGVDGAVHSGSLRVPPFDAPSIHCLDHPDYVLVYLNEGKRGTTLQHKHNSFVSTPFAKIVLYPLFREERMLPRDTTLLSGESLSQFSLSFKNPDGTPYQFHGCDFSFSLNFVKVHM